MRLERSFRFGNSGATHGSDGRTQFERDRDRILYTPHFRRLAGVTQVTTPTELQTFHNRLTHTLEVAQISRRMAQRVLRLSNKCAKWVDPDACEAAALAHDLGHPPFGHNGEKALDQIAKTFLSESGLNADEGYEGNAQSFRILTKLASRDAESVGLDLTIATLTASLKYPWLVGQNPDKPLKYGVFRAEIGEFSALQMPTGFGQTIEAQIMDWADDVAYAVHDFQDFAAAGLIPVSFFRSISPEGLKSHLAQIAPDLNPSEMTLRRLSQTVFGLLPPTEKTIGGLHSKAHAALRSWASMLIARYSAEELDVTVSRTGCSLNMPEPIVSEVKVLQQITYHYAINAPQLKVRQMGEMRAIETIFRALVRIERSGDTAQPKLNEQFVSEEALGRASKDGAVRVACDIISSLTDSQALALHRRLSGYSDGSILESLTPVLQ